MLSGNTTDLVHVAHYKDGLDIWNTINDSVPINGMTIQRKWDDISLSRIISSLHFPFPSNIHSARLQVSLKPEASMWSSALPP